MGSVGFMVGTGGAAIIAKTLGEKQQKKANQIFSMLIAFTAIMITSGMIDILLNALFIIVFD